MKIKEEYAWEALGVAFCLGWCALASVQYFTFKKHNPRIYNKHEFVHWKDSTYVFKRSIDTVYKTPIDTDQGPPENN